MINIAPLVIGNSESSLSVRQFGYGRFDTKGVEAINMGPDRPSYMAMGAIAIIPQTDAEASFFQDINLGCSRRLVDSWQAVPSRLP